MNFCFFNLLLKLHHSISLSLSLSLYQTLSGVSNNNNLAENPLLVLLQSEATTPCCPMRIQDWDVAGKVCVAVVHIYLKEHLNVNSSAPCRVLRKFVNGWENIRRDLHLWWASAGCGNCAGKLSFLYPWHSRAVIVRLHCGPWVCGAWQNLSTYFWQLFLRIF